MDSDHHLEYRFEDYRVLGDPDSALPFRVEIWDGGHLVEMIQIEELVLGKEIDPEEFEKSDSE